MRGSLDRVQSHAKPKPMKGSLDTGQSHPKPSRAKRSLNRVQSHAKPSHAKPMRASHEKVQSDAPMESISLPDMLRFLEEEEGVLTQMHRKVSDELHRLQVEEHVFLHTLEILRQKRAPKSKVSGNQQRDVDGDQELVEAIKKALAEDGDLPQAKVDKDGETS